MRNKDLTGVFTAVVTPFTKAQDIDLPWIRKHLLFQAGAGVDGIVICGTNGEGQCLSLDERKKLVEYTCRHKGKMRLIVGAGFVSVTETVDLGKFCEDFPVDALLVLPPYFDRSASQEGIAAFFEYVASNVNIPVLLYHLPTITGIPISIDLMERLASKKCIAGMKDSSGDPEHTAAIIELFPNLNVFSGSDRHILHAGRSNACGLISGTANVFPAQIVNAWKAAENGGGEEEQELVNALWNQLQGFPMRAAVKYALHLFGMPETSVRPPEIELTAAQKAELSKRLG